VIGDGAVVCAGSIVTKSLPAGCIAVGVPAKVVGYRPGHPSHPSHPGHAEQQGAE
jgi:acetyltransferase-like isoleucine patch superfamily enzyme